MQYVQLVVSVFLLLLAVGCTSQSNSPPCYVSDDDFQLLRLRASAFATSINMEIDANCEVLVNVTEMTKDGCKIKVEKRPIESCAFLPGGIDEFFYDGETLEIVDLAYYIH